jgi:adenylylsulfate reductase subunit B
MPPLIDRKKCKRCGLCAEICPEDVFWGSQKKKYPRIKFPEECWHCGACLLDCPGQAISLYIPLPMRVCSKQ